MRISVIKHVLIVYGAVLYYRVAVKFPAAHKTILSSLMFGFPLVDMLYCCTCTHNARVSTCICHIVAKYIAQGRQRHGSNSPSTMPRLH